MSLSELSHTFQCEKSRGPAWYGLLLANTTANVFTRGQDTIQSLCYFLHVMNDDRHAPSTCLIPGGDCKACSTRQELCKACKPSMNTTCYPCLPALSSPALACLSLPLSPTCAQQMAFPAVPCQHLPFHTRGACQMHTSVTSVSVHALTWLANFMLHHNYRFLPPFYRVHALQIWIAAIGRHLPSPRPGFSLPPCLAGFSEFGNSKWEGLMWFILVGMMCCALQCQVSRFATHTGEGSKVMYLDANCGFGRSQTLTYLGCLLVENRSTWRRLMPSRQAIAME